MRVCEIESLTSLSGAVRGRDKERRREFVVVTVCLQGCKQGGNRRGEVEIWFDDSGMRRTERCRVDLYGVDVHKFLELQPGAAVEDFLNCYPANTNSRSVCGTVRIEMCFDAEEEEAIISCAATPIMIGGKLAGESERKAVRRDDYFFDDFYRGIMCALCRGDGMVPGAWGMKTDPDKNVASP